jgi:hypothetical protein
MSRNLNDVAQSVLDLIDTVGDGMGICAWRSALRLALRVPHDGLEDQLKDLLKRFADAGCRSGSIAEGHAARIVYRALVAKSMDEPIHLLLQLKPSTANTHLGRVLKAADAYDASTSARSRKLAR